MISTPRMDYLSTLSRKLCDSIPLLVTSWHS